MGYRKHPIGAGKSELRRDSTGSGKCVPSFLDTVKGGRPGKRLATSDTKRKGMPYPGSPEPKGMKPSGSPKPHPSGVGSRMWHR